MELRSLGSFSLRLRPHSSPLFLTPSFCASRCFVPTGHSPDSVLFNLTSSQKKALSTFGSPLQASAETTASSPAPESDSSQLPPTKNQPDSIKHLNYNEMNLLMDEAGIMKSPGRRYPSIDSPIQAQSSKSESSPSSKSSPLSSFDILTKSYGQRSSRGAIHDQMMIPGQPDSNNAHDPTSFPAHRPARAPPSKPLRPRAVRTIESSPRVGRTIEINTRKGVDVSAALRKLHSECMVNNVRHDRYSQRYHERPGLKRKRLRRQRWRARFKQGFRALVVKVQAMRRKGW